MGNNASKQLTRKLPKEIQNINLKASQGLPSKDAFSRDRVDPKFNQVKDDLTSTERAELHEKLKKFNKPIENELAQDFLKTKGQGNMLEILKNRQAHDNIDKNTEESAIFNLSNNKTSTLRPIDLNDLIRKGSSLKSETEISTLAKEYKLDINNVKVLLTHVKPCKIIPITE